MFGDDVRDEITSNILEASGYPRALTVLMCMLIAIIPLTKVPLNARPIISTAEVLLGLHQPVVSDNEAAVRHTAYWRGFLRIVVRVVTIFSFLAIAILFPAFDIIMAFMGSALCYTICVTYVSCPVDLSSLPSPLYCSFLSFPPYPLLFARHAVGEETSSLGPLCADTTDRPAFRYSFT